MSTFNDFIRKLYGKNESVSTCVLGPNQVGKTDFNLLQMERIHDLGIGDVFCSNMKSLKADFEISFVQDFETLKKNCQMLNPNPKKHGLKKCIFLGSEIGKWAARDKAWLNTDLIGEFQTVRKIGLSMLTDAIDRVDARVLSPAFFAGEFNKPFKDNPKFAVWKNYATGQIMQFKDIPKTRIEYDTYETAYFYMKPQVPEDIVIKLNYEHQLLKRYIEAGYSWKKAGIHPQEGKRARDKVIDQHMDQYIQTIQEEEATKAVFEPVADT